MKKKIKVLVIDDSAVMRQLLSAILQEDPAIEVVGVAADPHIARSKIKALKPDVLTLDVEMPGMDGITFLENLMRLHPLPVVMVSSLTKSGAESTLRALELGAVDFVTKPQVDVNQRIGELESELRDKVRAAATARLRLSPLAAARMAKKGAVSSNTLAIPSVANKNAMIAIGASAGGTQAIQEILVTLPLQTPGLLIVQHMPPNFTAFYAKRVNELCAIEVREANNADRLTQGVALIAPGGYHMSLRRDSQGYAVRVYVDEPVNRHRPSVDVLFNSVAQHAGEDALGIILTGMGADGARGIHAMKQAGSYTIAQDKKSCVVFGMPNQAIRLGGISEIAALQNIPDRIMQWISGASGDSEFYSEHR